MDAISKNNAIPQTTRNRMTESGSFLQICPFFAFFPTTRKTIFILLWFYFEWRSWIVRFLELKTTTTKISGLLFILISGPMFQIKKTRTAIIHDNLITCIIQGPALLKNVSVGSPSRPIQRKKPENNFKHYDQFQSNRTENSWTDWRHPTTIQAKKPNEPFYLKAKSNHPCFATLRSSLNIFVVYGSF